MRETLPRPDVGFAEALVYLHRTGAEDLGDDGCRELGALQIARPDGVEHAERQPRLGGLQTTGFAEWWIRLTLPLADRVPLALTMSNDEQARRQLVGSG